MPRPSEGFVEQVTDVLIFMMDDPIEDFGVVFRGKVREVGVRGKGNGGNQGRKKSVQSFISVQVCASPFSNVD